MKIEAFYSSSAGNLYRLDNGETPLLIEAGVPIRKIKEALNFGISDIQGCLVSHSHLDHARSVSDVMKAGVDCWMHRNTAEALSLKGHRLHTFDDGESLTVGNWRVQSFPTEHDCPGSVGFLMTDGRHKVLFATDTYYLRFRFNGLTHILVEANYSIKTLDPNLDPVVKQRLFKSHFSLEHLLDFLAANDLRTVQEIHLIHLSERNSDTAYFKAEVEKLTGKPVYVADQGCPEMTR